jgi:hypothetical protein
MEIVYHEDEEAASELVQDQRRSICAGCSNYTAAEDSCSECSCLITRKVFYLHSECPIGKW